MTSSISDDSDGFGITLEEYIVAKERAATLALDKLNLQQHCKSIEADNVRLREALDSLMSLVERKLYGKTQHDLANAYAQKRQADYYYNIDVVGACSVQCPSCPVGNSTE